MAPRPRTMDERKKSPQPPRGPMGPLKLKVGQLAARWPHNIEWVGSGVEGGFFFALPGNDLATICVGEKNPRLNRDKSKRARAHGAWVVSFYTTLLITGPSDGDKPIMLMTAILCCVVVFHA